jgi:rubrerythrin
MWEVGAAIMFTIGEVFDLAIRLESNGENFYRRLVGSMVNPDLNVQMLWLADQEEKHGHFFTRLKQESSAQPIEDLGEHPEGSLLQDFLGEHALSLDEVDPHSLADVPAVLQFALEFEKDTILFFDMIRAFITEQAVLEGLDAIIQEENRHIKVLQDLYAAEVK